MATTTTVSAWGKAGAWALDSEEHEEELMNQTNQQEEEEKKKKTNKYSLVHNQSQPLSDFPSLSSAAAVTKTKKKKPQAVPLSEFTTGKSVSYGSAAKPKGLTPDELFLLPTGPRERSAEELDRSSRLGGGFRSYGSSSDNNNNRDDSRWGSNRDDPRRTIREPAPPSRADEIDDWGAAKKSSSSSDNRRERASPGFFDSQSRADESDSWFSKKSFIPSSSSDHPRRMGMGGGAGGGGFERDRRGGGFDKEISGSGAGADSDNWGKKRPQDTGPNNSDNGARPKLVLQPRSLPATNEEQQQPGSASVTTTKSNPFGAARPREQVLAEKGQDWKKIDEQLESIKLKDDDAFGKKTFGNGNGNGRLSSPEARTERSWRKTISVDSPTPSEEKADGGVRDGN